MHSPCNKVFAKYQAQGGVNPTPLAYALALECQEKKNFLNSCTESVPPELPAIKQFAVAISRVYNAEEVARRTVIGTLFRQLSCLIFRCSVVVLTRCRLLFNPYQCSPVRLCMTLARLLGF